MNKIKFKKIIFLLCFLVICTTFFASGCIRRINKYSGRRFYMIFPEGWKKSDYEVETIPIKSSNDNPEIITYTFPKIDPDTQVPMASISLFAVKLDEQLWIEDQIKGIMNVINMMGFEVIDKGEIKIQEQVNKWVLMVDKKIPLMILEFYSIDDGNIFYKIQYTAPPKYFNKFRPQFEKAKSTFKFKMSIF